MLNKQATNHTKNQSRKEWLVVVTRNRGGTWVGENRGSFQTGTYRTYEVTINDCNWIPSGPASKDPILRR
jgi:hypothetical protein